MPLLDDALQLASVSGIFDPEVLVKQMDVAKEDRDEVWRELSLHVRETLSDDEQSYGWVLTPECRRTYLKRFVRKSRLREAVKRSPKAWKSDAFGQVLQKILVKGTHSLGSTRLKLDADFLVDQQRDLAAALDAIQFAQAIPALDKNNLKELASDAKRRIQIIQRRRDMAILMPDRHVGYEKQRRKLSDFLRGKGDDIRPMLLVGTGGAGKSALIARIVSAWQTRKSKPITIILDFDRRQLNGGEPGEILSEFFRQMENAIAGKLLDQQTEQLVAEGIHSLRSGEVFTSMVKGLANTDAELGYYESSLGVSLEMEWVEHLKSVPIALVLDSFEAVDRRGGEAVRTILELERLLRSSFHGLRTVVSGRAKPLNDSDIEHFFGQKVLKLSGLTNRDGAELLATLDNRDPQILVNEGFRREVSEALAGHPLALIVFAQYARTHRDEIGQLIADLQGDAAFQAEFAQIFLYERVLDRIDDVNVRSLAHPGLILRQLSDNLIRYVLAGPCMGCGPEDHAPMQQEEANKLKTLLAEEYWLVEPGEPPFELRHLPELRRMMVPGLFAPPRPEDNPTIRKNKQDLAAKARAVCKAMVQYLSEGPPSNASEEAELEWEAFDRDKRELAILYYSSFIDPEEVPTMDADLAQRLEFELGSDVETMPLAWRAVINVLLGRAPTSAELQVLPLELREAGEQLIFERDRSYGLGSTGRNFTRPRLDYGSSDNTVSEKPIKQTKDWPVSKFEREINRAFASANFATVANLVPHYIEAKKGEARRTGQLWESSLWQCWLLASQYYYEGFRPLFWQRLAASRNLKATNLFGEGSANGDPSYDWKALAKETLPQYVDFNRLVQKLLPEKEMPISRGLCIFSQLPTNGRKKRILINLGDEINEILLQSSFRLSDFASGYDVLKKKEPDMLPLSSKRNGTFRALFKFGVSEDDNRVAHMIRRGLNPDLYPPLIHIFRQFPDQILHDIVLQFQKKIPYWPVELDAEREHRSWQNIIPTIIEIADKCGALRRLMNIAAPQDPRIEEIIKMYDDITSFFFGEETAIIIKGLTVDELDVN